MEESHAYSINTEIDANQTALLSKVNGATITKMSFEEVGEFVLSVLIESTTVNLLIINNPVEEADEDEYPKFEIKSVNDQPQNLEEEVMVKIVEGVEVIRDKITWQNDNLNWDVRSDIAIKIKFKEEQICLIAHDSLAGFIKKEFIKSEDRKEEDLLLDQFWSMKTDLPQSHERERIMV
ncbi:hypothetical protein [Shouchella patagoniensis]|uniref:hypothetical protein n=1 Tax=Shouchella patagoniensis TaxID=228576 RepID=UPI000995289F|nr:hypothetical protein [Shouchella patagoniensis]